MGQAFMAFLLNTIYISSPGTTKHNANNVLYPSGHTTFPHGVHESLVVDCTEPAKRAATEIHGKTSAKQLFFEEKPAQKNGGDHEEPMEGDSLTFLRLKNTEETEELTTQVRVRDQDLQVDQVNER